MVERCGECGLEDVIGGVGKVVGQLNVVAKVAVTAFEVVAGDALHAAVGERVVGGLVTPVALEVLVAEVVGQRELTVARVVFAVNGVAAAPVREQVGGIQAEFVALRAAPCVDVDDILDAVTVAHTRVVDILDTVDALRVEGSQVVGGGLDAVDADLHAAVGHHGGDGAGNGIYLQPVHGHHRQQLIDIGRMLQLRCRRKNYLSVGLVDDACSLHLHRLQVVRFGLRLLRFSRIFEL